MTAGLVCVAEGTGRVFRFWEARRYRCCSGRFGMGGGTGLGGKVGASLLDASCEGGTAIECLLSVEDFDAER